MRRWRLRFGILVGAAGLAGTVGAILLPWARYGSSGFAVHRFPGWGWYLSLVIVLHAYAGWVLVADARAHGAAATVRSASRRIGELVVGLLLCAGALTVAILLMRRYDDAGAFHGPIVPMVRPFLGPGGPLAVLGILGTAVAIHRATRPGRG